MTTFSKKERIIASVLSAFPGLKAFIKNVYVSLNSFIYKKNYSLQLMAEPVKIRLIDPLEHYDSKSESFGGYYDTPTTNGQGLTLSHISSIATSKLPSAIEPVDIVLTDINTGLSEKVGQSYAYNWQQGSRLHWLTDDLFVYNDFDKIEERYSALIYSVVHKKMVKTFDYPVQATYADQYYLSINYIRLMNMRPDYGYRNLSLLDQKELEDLNHDGIWQIDFKTEESILLHSLKEVVETAKKDSFDKCIHYVNHLMIRPDGKGFMFIHRYYQGKRRFDRLLYSDFKSLKVLIDEEYVSHCYWVDNETVLGYLKAKGENGYYFLNISNGEVTLCEEMTNLNLGDGHPSYYKGWIVFDSYPDKSRMQRLMLFNSKQKKLFTLAELYQSTRYKNETRCDLHPRFSSDGRYISFDSVYDNKRRQLVINVEEIVVK